MAKIKKKHLLRIGYEPGDALRAALAVMDHPAYQKKGRETKMQMLQEVLFKPEKFYKHNLLGPVAKALKPEETDPNAPVYPKLREEHIPFKVYGEQGIEPGALHQMYTAAKLPIAVGAALMPDAHQGYGLPIGGVLATQNTIIPYAVGVDIGCRMCLSVLPLGEKYLEKHHAQLKRELIAQTTFGAGKGPKDPMDDPVLERPEFKDLAIVKGLQDKAWRQIGSSGGGNHFVEFGLVELTDAENEWEVPTGTYLAILSHSGSRGLGAGIAQHYTREAMRQNRLPSEAKHLAWLDLDSEQGIEYWLAMNLAGDYASACHHHIHRRLTRALGEKALFMVENHHNFAWKEKMADGQEVIVHRKGATPAGKGVLGIIPGSMTAPGFIVRGKGAAASLQSASHGAGRVLSRTKAKNSITNHELKKLLREAKVTLVGGGLDEAPHAYKDIRQVMASQTDLVDVVGTFHPKIVRMAGD
ncbi:MAG: RtcB family protein [Bacteroidota bacterium]